MGNKEMQAHVESRARIASESAAAKETLSDTKASLAEAEKFLAEMEAMFESKTATFEANQKLRAEELQVLAKAIEIISSPEVVSNYGKHVKSFVQLPVGRTPSFLQMHAASAARIGTRGAAANFLSQRAQALHSKTLASFAAQLAANPFAKVIDMVTDLLARLKQEAADEADHKAFCDEELKKNKQTRKDKESESARLMAEIEEKAKDIAEMGKEITLLAEEQAELRKSMKEATEVRTTEKKENEVAIADAQAAQVALKQAMAVLQEFYGSEALIQMRQVPEMEAYTGMKTRGGGVMGMLEVIDSDFARVESETEAAEVQAAEQYKSFMKEAEADVEAKHEAEFKLSLKKDKTEFAQEQLQKDLDAAQAQLKAANQYYEELKPQCVKVHVSFEERATMRQEEIAALQEAYKILDGKSAM